MDDLEVADARVTTFLLEEIVHALLARRALIEEDVAGALLRVERRAAKVERLGGDISGTTSGVADMTTTAWDDALGLRPQLFVLRKSMEEWEARGAAGRMPLHAVEIAARYSDDE